MKNSIKMAVMICLFNFILVNQQAIAQTPATQNDSASSSSGALITAYLEIKDALVAADVKTASAKSIEFNNALQALDSSAFIPADQHLFNDIKQQLAVSSKRIAEGRNINEQRNEFSDFSNHMIAFTNSGATTSTSLYQMYCPMKKAYWISSEKTIRNPYYGKQMLSCGKIDKTIN